MSYIEPEAEQVRQFVLQFPDDEPVTMLNLLCYRDQAHYLADAGETTCTGREAYRRYAAAVMPWLEAVGARIAFSGAASAGVIGPADEHWHDVLLVEYPNKQAFVTMTTSAEYRAIAHHRSAALADSRLVPLAAGAPSFARD
ncbi:MAG: DUF1330 domain-containing protein [Gammaproteobacteria bacterium]